MSDLLNFTKMDGLIPVITVDYSTNEVLMLAYMNKEAWEKTLKTGKACYYSRTRDALWLKGEKSGNFQLIKEIFVDCDEDTLLLKVEQIGDIACHTGYRSCFYRRYDNGKLITIDKKIREPEDIYGR